MEAVGTGPPLLAALRAQTLCWWKWPWEQLHPAEWKACRSERSNKKLRVRLGLCTVLC